MGVAVHNPSNIDNAQHRFAVLQGKYQVKGFNTQTQAFEDVKSVVTCSNDLDVNKQPMVSCFLTVDYLVQSHEVGYLEVAYTASDDANMKPLKRSDKITDGQISAIFKSASNN